MDPTKIHNHAPNVCPFCVEASLYKQEHQSKKRDYAKFYYEVNKEAILLRKALERAERGSKLNRRTKERLHEAQIASPMLQSC